MFCPNCGKKNKIEAKFCSKCGKAFVIKTDESSKENQETLVEAFANKNNFSNFLNKIKKNVIKYQKPLYGLIGISVILILSISLFNYFHDFTEIKWDKTTKQFNQKFFTYNSKISLIALAQAKDQKITNIKFKANFGKLKVNQNKVEWQLPNKNGEYQIKAIAPSGKFITKNVKVLKDFTDKPLLLKIKQPKQNDNDDYDQDGLTNAQEKKHKTNPNLKDTDKDGLTDFYEINTSKTNPLKPDSDQDGIKDAGEVLMRLNPLKKDSKDDGITDSKRKLTYNYQNQDKTVNITVKGKGAIYDTEATIIQNNTLKYRNDLINKIYDFNTTGKIESADLEISYSPEDLKVGMKEDNLTLYYINTKKGTLKPIKTEIDPINKKIKAKLSHFSLYVIGDKEKVVTKPKNNVMFVIDNSGSMYSGEQVRARTDNCGHSCDNHTGTDENFNRLKISKQTVDILNKKGDYKYAVLSFSGGNKLLQDFSKDTKKVKQKIDKIKTKEEFFGIGLFSQGGTNIRSALEEAIDNFPEKSASDQNKIFFLTDGEETAGSLGLYEKDIIESAKSKNIQICSILLGEGSKNNVLSKISEETGCGTQVATNSNRLSDSFQNTVALVNYGVKEQKKNQKQKESTILIADSGFRMGRDNFSFANYGSNRSTGGHCYGMASFASLYYQKKLPMNLEAKETKILWLNSTKKTSNGYDLSNSYFDGYKNNLYDYKIKSSGLKEYLYSKDKFYDKAKIDNQTWVINQPYRGILDQSKMFSFDKYKIIDPRCKKEEIKNLEEALLNQESEAYKDLKNNDKQVLEAIWRLFIQQDAGLKEFNRWKEDINIDQLTLDLKNKIPVLTAINGNHAINSISLERSQQDQNKYIINTYDNNYPDKATRIIINRNKIYDVNIQGILVKTVYENSYKYDNNKKIKDISKAYLDKATY